MLARLRSFAIKSFRASYSTCNCLLSDLIRYRFRPLEVLFFLSQFVLSHRITYVTGELDS